MQVYINAGGVFEGVSYEAGVLSVDDRIAERMLARLFAKKVQGVVVGDDGEIYEGDGGIIAPKNKPSNLTLLDFSFQDSANGWSSGANHSISFDANLKGLSIKGSGVSGTNISTTKDLQYAIPAAIVKRVAVKIKTKTPGLRAELYIRFGNASGDVSAVGAHCLLAVGDSDDDGWKWVTFDTSEDSTFLALGSITKVRLQTVSQSPASVYLNNIVIQKIVINPSVVSPVVFTFDDGWDTAFTRAYRKMKAAGFKGSIFWPSEGGNVAANRRIDIDELSLLKADGWDIALDGTFNDDPPMTSYASPEAAVQAFLRCQQSAFASGLYGEDFSYLCYPNGEAWVSAVPVLMPAATSNGTATISLGSPANVVNGSAYYAANAPEGTTVLVGGVGVTSIVVSQNINAGTIAAAAVDVSSPFGRSVLADRLASVGVRGARLTSRGDNSIIEGLINPLKIYAIGVTNKNTSQILAEFDLLVRRGCPVIFYFHEQVEDPPLWSLNTINPWINIYDSCMNAIIDAAYGYVKAGLAEGMTFKQLVKRYAGMK